LLEVLSKAAKENLMRSGFICPVFFLVRDEFLVAEPVPTDKLLRLWGKIPIDEAKSRAVYIMGQSAKKVGANRIIMIWDAAMKIVKSFEDYDPTEAPLTYPKSMRTECIILNDIHLETERDSTVIIPYKGGDGEPVEFLPDDDFKGMQSESRFTKIAVRAYKAG
jgi:hypothetical protein